MTDQPLIVRDDTSLTVRFLPQAEELKTEALAKVPLFRCIRTAEENAVCHAANEDVTRLIKWVEDTAEEIRAPFYDAWKRVIKTKNQWLAELHQAKTFMDKMEGDFQALELARMKAEEAARLKSLAEIERQREAELAQAQTFEQRDAIQERYCEEIAASVPPVKAPERAAGQVVREDWEIVVIDANMLARFHPNCVTIKPKLAEIKLMLDAGLQVNGIRAERKIKAGVRLGKEQEAITLHG